MKIPIIRATEDLQQIPVTATTKGAGRAWNAVGQLGEQVQAIGLDIAETQQKLRMRSDLSQAEIDMELANTNISNNLKKNPDPDTYVQNWLAQTNEVKNETLKTARGVRTKANMEVMLNRIQTRELVRQMDYARKLSVETEQAKDVPILD